MQLLCTAPVNSAALKYEGEYASMMTTLGNNPTATDILVWDNALGRSKSAIHNLDCDTSQQTAQAWHQLLFELSHPMLLSIILTWLLLVQALVHMSHDAVELNAMAASATWCGRL